MRLSSDTKKSVSFAKVEDLHTYNFRLAHREQLNARRSCGTHAVRALPVVPVEVQRAVVVGGVARAVRAVRLVAPPRPPGAPGARARRRRRRRRRLRREPLAGPGDTHTLHTNSSDIHTYHSINTRNIAALNKNLASTYIPSHIHRSSGS